MKRSETSIKTERLWMRQIDETDAESIVKLRSDENIYRYFLTPKKLTVGEHKKWYNDSYITSDERIDWIAVDDGTGAFIGIYGAKKISLSEAEISYITDHKHKNKGYATEAVKAIIDWCVDIWKVPLVTVSIHRENVTSLHFASDLGFQNLNSRGDFIIMGKEVRIRV